MMKKTAGNRFWVVSLAFALASASWNGASAFVIDRSVSTTSCHAPSVAFYNQQDHVAATTTCNRPAKIITTTTALNFFFNNKKANKVVEEKEPVFPPVVIDPDFRVAALFLALGAVLDTVPYIQWIVGPFITALGVLFLVQTFRLRFVFDGESPSNFELVTVRNPWTGELPDDATPGENVIVGGANKWSTKRIFNYDFFPKGWIDGPVGPILVYFKEDQTPSETWNEGPGKIANDPDKIAAGVARPGQVHFFPAVANAQQLRDEFAKRGCKKI